MLCEKHSIEMQFVCDTPSCGLCYEEKMAQERQIAKLLPQEDLSKWWGKGVLQRGKIKKS
jgi:hypothetical protein